MVNLEHVLFAEGMHFLVHIGDKSVSVGVPHVPNPIDKQRILMLNQYA